MTPARRPGFGELLDWLEGRLNAADSALMAQRVADSDQTTQRTVAWIRTFLEAGRQHPLAQPPPLLRQRLRQAFESHVDGPLAVDRLLAQLTFDSRSGPELVGVRAGGTPYDLDSYQLAFRAMSGSLTVDVLLDVTGAGDGSFRLDGQVFTPDPDAPVWEARVEQDARSLRDVEGDDLGTFSLPGVAPGPARLLLTNGRLEVEVPLLVAPASG